MNTGKPVFKLTKTAMDPVRHMPKYGNYLLQTLFSPILIFFAILGNVCLMGGVYVFYTHEQAVNPNVSTWFDALWWGMSTVTTVGYGDIVPMTIEGRITGIFLMLTGLILFISFSALLVSMFFARAESDIYKTQTVTHAEFEAVMQELRELKAELQSLKKS